MRPAWLLTLALSLAGCGIKGAPRPPLDEPEPAAQASAQAPDGGCCREKR